MIKVGLRSRLLICGITLIAGYSYWYAGTPILKLIVSLVFFVSAGVMVWQFVHYFGKHIVNIVKIMYGGRKAVSWVEISEFNDLAKRMGVKLHRKRPFGIRKGLNNAYANCLTGQIIFGEDLLQKLGSQERLALAAHEFTHLKQNHWVRMFQYLRKAFNLFSYREVLKILFVWRDIQLGKYKCSLSFVTYFKNQWFSNHLLFPRLPLP